MKVPSRTAVGNMDRPSGRWPTVGDPRPGRALTGTDEAHSVDRDGSQLQRLAARAAQAAREDLPQVVADLLAVEAECERLRALAWSRIMSAKIEERLYSVRDLAQRWGLSRQRIYELIDRKALPAVRIDRALRVRHHDVLTFEA